MLSDLRAAITNCLLDVTGANVVLRFLRCRAGHKCRISRDSGNGGCTRSVTFACERCGAYLGHVAFPLNDKGHAIGFSWVAHVVCYDHFPNIRPEEPMTEPFDCVHVGARV